MQEACQLCGDDTTATLWCTECQLALCVQGGCDGELHAPPLSWHQRLPERSAEPSGQCQMCRHEIATVFCHDCHVALCQSGRCDQELHEAQDELDLSWHHRTEIVHHQTPQARSRALKRTLDLVSVEAVEQETHSPRYSSHSSSSPIASPLSLTPTTRLLADQEQWKQQQHDLEPQDLDDFIDMENDSESTRASAVDHEQVLEQRECLESNAVSSIELFDDNLNFHQQNHDQEFDHESTAEVEDPEERSELTCTSNSRGTCHPSTEPIDLPLITLGIKHTRRRVIHDAVVMDEMPQRAHLTSRVIVESGDCSQEDQTLIHSTPEQEHKSRHPPALRLSNFRKRAILALQSAVERARNDRERCRDLNDASLRAREEEVQARLRQVERREIDQSKDWHALQESTNLWLAQKEKLRCDMEAALTTQHRHAQQERHRQRRSERLQEKRRLQKLLQAAQSVAREQQKVLISEAARQRQRKNPLQHLHDDRLRRVHRQALRVAARAQNDKRSSTVQEGLAKALALRQQQRNEEWETEQRQSELAVELIRIRRQERLAAQHHAQIAVQALQHELKEERIAHQCSTAALMVTKQQPTRSSSSRSSATSVSARRPPVPVRKPKLSQPQIPHLNLKALALSKSSSQHEFLVNALKSSGSSSISSQAISESSSSSSSSPFDSSSRSDRSAVYSKSRRATRDLSTRSVTSEEAFVVHQVSTRYDSASEDDSVKESARTSESESDTADDSEWSNASESEDESSVRSRRTSNSSASSLENMPSSTRSSSSNVSSSSALSSFSPSSPSSSASLSCAPKSSSSSSSSSSRNTSYSSSSLSSSSPSDNSDAEMDLADDLTNGLESARSINRAMMSISGCTGSVDCSDARSAGSNSSASSSSIATSHRSSVKNHIAVAPRLRRVPVNHSVAKVVKRAPITRPSIPAPRQSLSNQSIVRCPPQRSGAMRTKRRQPVTAPLIREFEPIVSSRWMDEKDVGPFINDPATSLPSSLPTYGSMGVSWPLVELPAQDMEQSQQELFSVLELKSDDLPLAATVEKKTLASIDQSLEHLFLSIQPSHEHAQRLKMIDKKVAEAQLRLGNIKGAAVQTMKARAKTQTRQILSTVVQGQEVQAEHVNQRQSISLEAIKHELRLLRFKTSFTNAPHSSTLSLSATSPVSAWSSSAVQRERLQRSKQVHEMLHQ